MKISIAFIILLFASPASWAQRSLTSNPDLYYMIESERAFAKMAKDQNKRDAFLYYMSDSVVTSGKEGPVVGKAEIIKQKVDNGWLKWDVAFADINATGDLGYTTGPWEFRVNKTDKTPVAWGEFNSIWRKNEDGTWKNVCDIGVSHKRGISVDSTALKLPVSFSTYQKIINRKEDLLYLEKLFIADFKKNKAAAYRNTLAAESRIIHKGRFPIISPEQKEKCFMDLENISDITPVNGFIPRSGDLGYVYGKAMVSAEVEGKTESRTATYLRVWKKEDGKKWKVVLDVLTY